MNSKKFFWYSIAAISLTCTGISLLVIGFHNGDNPTVIVAGFTFLLDLIVIVAFLVDYLKKR